MVNPLFLHAWARCPGVGMAVVGDAALIDALWPQLIALAGPTVRLSPGMDLTHLSQEAATAVVSYGEAWEPEMAAAIRAQRILVRTATLADLPGALADAAPAVLELNQESSPQLVRALLQPAELPGVDPAAAVAAVPAEKIVHLLTTAGLAAARLDVPAAQFAAQLATLGADETLIMQGVFELFVAPRTELTEPPPPPDPAEEEAPEQQQSRDESQESEELPPQEPDAPAPPPQLVVRNRAGRTRWPGRGGAEEFSASRGRIRRVLPHTGDAPLAILPTLAAAAPWQPLRRSSESPRIVVTKDDLRTQQRVTRGAGLAIIVVDASGSMGLGAIRTAKSIALGILDQGYRNRDRVAIVVAKGGEAYLGLPPTKSVTRARDCVRSLPTGGGTPLASGLLMAHKLASRHPPERVRTIVLSDGAANVGFTDTGKDIARRDARRALRQLETASLVHLMPLGNNRGARRRGDPLAWLTAP